MSQSKISDKTTENRCKNDNTEALDLIQVQSSSNYKKEINARLEEFITYFVEEFEAKLQVCYMVLEGKMEKSGKFSEIASESIGQGIGGIAGGLIGFVLGFGTAGAAFGATTGQKISKKLGTKIGSENYRKNVTNLIDLVNSFKQDKYKFRQKLVEIGFDIFQSFEMQFMRVTTDQESKKAMQLLARDATNRAINYCVQNKNASIVDGVIVGESKIEPFMGVPIYNATIKTPGYKIVYEDSNNKYEWSTASLYKKAGLVRKEKELESCFYVHENGESKVDKYGYRRLFATENWDEIKTKYKIFNNTEKSMQFTFYKYVLDPEEAEWKSKEILKKINQNDKTLSEDRLTDIIKENVEHILKEITLLKENCTSVEEKFLQNIEIILGNKFEQIFEEMKVNKREHKITQEKIDKLAAKIDEHPKNLQQKKLINIQPAVATFTGRTIELKNLQKQLQNEGKQIVISQVASITGLGGVGKSELARKYAFENEEYYEHLVWINAATEESVMDSFRIIARRLGIPVNDFTEDKKRIDLTYVVEEVYEYLNNRGRCLLIFDNAEEYKDIGTYLSKARFYSDNFHVLITSRNREWNIEEEGEINVVELNPFTPEEATKFVKDFLKIENISQDENIKQLVEVLQYFPLALIQAVAYIKEENKKLTKIGLEKFDIGTYLEIRQQHENKLLDYDFFRNSDRYTKTVFTTWTTTLGKIAENQKYGKQAIEILNIMAYLAPNYTPIKMFSHLYKDDKIRVNAIDLLDRYSIITIKKCFSDVHRLVQDVTRIKLEMQDKYKRVIQRTFELLRENCEKTALQDCSQVRVLLPHLETFLSHLDDLIKRKCDYRVEIENSYLENLLQWLDDLYNFVAEFKKEVNVLERLMRIQKRRYGKDSGNVYESLGKLGIAHINAGDFQKAKNLFDKCLKNDAIKGCHRAALLISLSYIYQVADNSVEQLGLLMKALEIIVKQYGYYTIEVSKVLELISYIFIENCLFPYSMQLLERALAIKEEYYYSNHLKAATNMDNTKELILSRVLEFDPKEILLEVVNTLIKISLIYKILNDQQGGIDTLDRALAIVEENNSTEILNDLKIASLRVLSDAYEQFQNYQKVTQLREKVNKIIEISYHPQTIQITKEWIERYALLHELKCYKIMPNSLKKVDFIEQFPGGPQELEVIFEQPFTKLTKFYGTDLTSYLVIAAGALYINLREFQKAEKLIKRLLNYYLKMYGPENLFVANTRIYLASIYEKLNNPETGLQLLEKASKTFKYKLNSGNIAKTNQEEIFCKLIQAYTVFGEKEKADELKSFQEREIVKVEIYQNKVFDRIIQVLKQQHILHP